jgi:AmmeMemoRadiSam system protein A
MTWHLADDERSLLLKVARESIAAKTTGCEVLDLAADPLSFNGGAFVTLRIADSLRGCIGETESSGSLVETVRHVAAAAASEDPRFPPLRPDELHRVVVEVSVLGPLEPCAGAEGIEVGRHGLVVERGARRGLLLPQVAVEWGWDAHTFLAKTCIKAGLPPGAWASETTLFTFEADVFSEPAAGPRDSEGP